MDALRNAGWNPSWPFVVADLGNPSFVEAIRADPGISEGERSKILSFVPGGEGYRRMFAPAPAPVPAPASPAATALRNQEPVATLTFKQFLNAPREGKLMEALRKLPKRIISEEESNLKNQTDDALDKLSKANASWVLDSPNKAYSLNAKQKKLLDKYNKAWNARSAYLKANQERIQREIYDQAVEAGFIADPSAVKETAIRNPKTETNPDIPDDLREAIENEKRGSGPLTPMERVDLNELEILRNERGRLSLLNQARLDHLRSRNAASQDPVVSWLESKIDPRLDEPGTRSGGLNPNVLIRAAIASHKAGKPFAEAVEDALKTGRSLYGSFDEGAVRNRIVAGMAGVLRESNLQPGQKIRKFAERATVSPQLSDEAKLRVAADPTIVYDPQKVSTEANAASLKTDADLGSDWGNPESNTAVISGLELVNRALRTNQPDVAARNIAELAHRGTTLGQLVNQFKLLKGTLPEYTTFLADKHLQSAGYDPLTPVQRTQLTGLTAKSINAHKATEAADATYLGNRTPENWRKVSDAYRAEQEANAELNYQLARWRPRSMQDVLVAILQGNLMTPLSQTANVMGNAFKFGYEPSVRTGAAVLDAIESAVTGTPRTSTLRPIQGSVAKLRSLAEASKVAADIVRRGADTVHYEAGEKGGAALNAPRSWGDIIGWFRGQSDLPTRGGKVPPIDIAKRFLEGTFGIPADAMFRGLASMDVMFRVPERGRLIFDEAKRGGLSDEEAMRAVARPELFLPKDALARVDFESARTVYQQDNLANSSVGRVNDMLRRVPGLYLLSRTVVPFQKTPVNVMGELLTYTPFGAFKLWGDLGYPGARRYARQMGTDTAVNRREANFTASKMAFGSVAMAAGAWMFAKGVISPPLDAEDEAQKTRLGTADALPANHINLSGLQRAIKGQDATPRPGDDIRDLRRLGLVGGLLYMTSFALRQAEKKRADPSSMASDIVGSAPSTVTSWALNQTFLTGVSDFLEKLKGGSGETAMTAWAQGVSAFALPNTMQAINRAIRESKPEFRDDSALQQFGNRLNDKVNALGFTVPLGREVKALPLKVDLWGRPISETPPGKNPLIWHFFDITKSRTIPEDVVAVELYNLWRRTTDTAVFPSIPARLLTVEGQQSEPITYDQYQELATDVGKSRRYLVEKLVGGEVGFNGKNWQGLNDEERIEALTKLYEDGRKIGMNQFVKVLIESGQTLTPRKARRGPVQVK